MILKIFKHNSFHFRHISSNSFSYNPFSYSSYDFYEEPKLGRWKIQYDENVIHCKIDQANEDHCGCCVNDFKEIGDIKDIKDTRNKDEEYLIPYCI